MTGNHNPNLQAAAHQLIAVGGIITTQAHAILDALTDMGRAPDRILTTPRSQHHPPTLHTPTPVHLPPAPIHTPLTALARAHTPTPAAPAADRPRHEQFTLTAARRQQILDVMRAHGATTWSPR